MKHCLVANIALAVAAFLPGTAWAAPQCGKVGGPVQTTSGIVRGQASEGAPGVSEYLGIPYAKPPLGSLRFQPPQKLSSRKSSVDATRFGFHCMQASAAPFTDKQAAAVGMPESANLVYEAVGEYPGGRGPLSEDCLTLNVWSKRQTGEAKKAVLFWIHGGSYKTGGSGLPVYDGKWVADSSDLVVVSVNYRLSVFGFPGNPQSASNLGLQDIRIAMEWVRDNIERFGGDKHRITMAGQSAGAGLVDYYSYAYVLDPIASGFILQSGVAKGTSAPIDTATAQKSWLGLAGKVGCPNNTISDETFECVVGKPATDLVSGLGSELTFVPVADNGLVFEEYDARQSAKGGYIVGVNDNEAGLMYMWHPSATPEQWAIANQYTFNCPAAERASRASAAGHPTWRYRYFGDFPNLVLTTKPPSGSYHMAEIPVYFNTTPQHSVPSTPDQVDVGNYMRGAFAAFAKDTTAGLLSYDGWPTYSAQSKTLVRLAYDNQAGLNLERGDLYDVGC